MKDEYLESLIQDLLFQLGSGTIRDMHQFLDFYGIDDLAKLVPYATAFFEGKQN